MQRSAPTRADRGAAWSSVLFALQKVDGRRSRERFCGVRASLYSCKIEAVLFVWKRDFARFNVGKMDILLRCRCGLQVHLQLGGCCRFCCHRTPSAWPKQNSFKGAHLGLTPPAPNLEGAPAPALLIGDQCACDGSVYVAP